MQFIIILLQKTYIQYGNKKRIFINSIKNEDIDNTNACLKASPKKFKTIKKENMIQNKRIFIIWGNDIEGSKNVIKKQ